jgi:hypothetical protein
MNGMVTSRDYEGLPLEQALKKAISSGFTPRIVEENGKSFMLTMDLVPNRINFRVRNDVIIEAYPG